MDDFFQLPFVMQFFMQFFAQVKGYFSNLAVLEWIAVIASLAYVIFAALGHLLCWPASIVSTVLYTFIFYEFYLWSDSILQLYYLVMAFYGWYCWQLSNKSDNTNLNCNNSTNVKTKASTFITISIWSKATHVKVIILLSVISLVVGYLMATYTPTDFPYLDAATTVFAVFATYLVTQKVLENWLYWIVIDFISIYLYVEKGLMPTAFLFMLYVVIAIFGYFNWLKSYLAEQYDDQSALA